MHVHLSITTIFISFIRYTLIDFYRISVDFILITFRDSSLRACVLRPFVYTQTAQLQYYTMEPFHVHKHEIYITNTLKSFPRQFS